MSECIETERCRDKLGYGKCGVMRYGKRVYLAHRLAWIDAHGKLPEPGMKILHSCDNPSCVNPEHLREGTDADNARDREERQRSRKGKTFATQCPSCGVEYSEVTARRDTRGCWICRSCSSGRARERYRRRKADTPV